MMNRSLTLEEKINTRLTPDRDVTEAMQLMKMSISPNRFKSPHDLAKHLVEGNLLNINLIGSKALSVPCGEYLVWTTDVGHTMLVPVSEQKKEREVFEHDANQYDVLTQDLLANWNKVEKFLVEKQMPPNTQQSTRAQQPASGEPNKYSQAQGNKETGKKSGIGVYHTDTIDRPEFYAAMTNAGYTPKTLAAATGLNISTISRYAREPDAGPGDPGGRDPSMAEMENLCKILRTTPQTLFPRNFGGTSA